MKTTSQAIADSGIPAKLIRSVVRQIGDKDRLRDVYDHGANAGYCGFTYCSDTCEFWKRNRKEIAALVIREAEELGESAVSFVAGFNCLKDDQDTGMLNAIGRAIYGGRSGDSEEDTLAQNALAWFALEEVARAFCDE